MKTNKCEAPLNEPVSVEATFSSPRIGSSRKSSNSLITANGNSFGRISRCSKNGVSGTDSSSIPLHQVLRPIREPNLIPDNDFFETKPPFTKSSRSTKPTIPHPVNTGTSALQRDENADVVAEARAEKQSAQARGRPVQSIVCPAWNLQSEQAVTRFRQWLSSQEHTLCPTGRRRGARVNDASFETWPVERLAAVLEHYYKEASTKHGRHYAPTTLYGIRSALALHLNRAHAKRPRGAIDLIADPAFDAANRALTRAVKKYKPSSMFDYFTCSIGL